MPSSDDLRLLLLDLLSTERQVDASRLAALGGDDWDVLLRLGLQHRIAPLLHRRLGHERAGLTLPPAVAQALEGVYRASAVRSLALQRDLVVVHRRLAAAGIPCIALKGAYLAFFAYPEPALRPLRDIDLLVREQAALEAYRVLLGDGYRAEGRLRGDPEALIAHDKHLPQLKTAAGVSVELHVRLAEPGTAGLGETAEAGVWERAVERRVAGETIAYQSPADLLFHLIVHALRVHRLSNGPLTLADVAFLVRTAAIEWPLFWRLAAEAETTRGCLLVLAMAERYFGSLPVEAPSVSAADWAEARAEAARAAVLILREPGAAPDVVVARALDGRSARGKAAFLLGRAFPSRAALATRHPVGAESPAVYAWYARRLVRLATRRLPAYLASRGSEAVVAESRRLAELERWLDGPSP